MIEISWEALTKNSESKEITFESFNYQIAHRKFSNYGSFEYDYNTPGSEFYLTLTKDCDELFAKAGDVIGWQAKFWVNHNDMNNTSFDTTNRSVLVEGLRKALAYKPNLKTWIICTPGQPMNSKPHYTKDRLINELLEVRRDIKIIFWNKPVYEAFLFEDFDKLLPIYSHYFSQRYLGIDFFKDYTKRRIKILNEKYDVDLYTEGEVDKEIYKTIDIYSLFDAVFKILNKLKDKKYEIEENEYINMDEFSYYPKELIDLLKKLIKYEFNLIDSAYNMFNNSKSIHTCDKILDFIHEQECSSGELIDNINNLLKDKNKLDTSKYDIKEEQCFNYLLESARSLRKTVYDLIKLLNTILKRNIHIFGRAGFGKTSLACSICNTMINNNVPALLLLASEFRSISIPIEKQIMNSLTLDDSLSFTDVLSALNNFGFLKKVKIPIVIDGLNETTPTADIWYHELFYLVEKIKKYEYLILITTCRESYVEQIFCGCKDYKEVENNLYLEGFNDTNIDLAIDKYFKKHDITVINQDFNKQILKHPLMLKIFCVVNNGSNIVLNQSNIFNAIDNYLVKLIEKVSIRNCRKNPFIESQVKKGIKILSQKLWDNNTRSVDYPLEFISLFDPNYDGTTNFEETNAYKVLDEGFFISRKMQENEEKVEFTYDLLGGYCIAKNVFFDRKDTGDIINFMSSADVLNKLVNSYKTQKVHPLSEDIMKSIIFLLPKYTGKQIFEVLSNNKINEYVISMLELVTYTEEGKMKFYQYISNLEPDNPAIKQLIDKIITEVLNNNYERIDLLVDIILRMNSVQIDISWSESIRKNSYNLNVYLDNIIELSNKGKVNQDLIINHLYFIALMLSSTNRLLRDNATKALVLLGTNHIDKFFAVLKGLEKISDLYIIDRLLATLFGIIIKDSDKEIAVEIAKYLEDKYIINIRTTHILVLDYVDTILDFIKYKYGYERIYIDIDSNNLVEWNKDPDCLREVNGDASWGYGPVKMDFCTYIIRSLTRNFYPFTEETPDLKDCLAMIIWKMKEYGYSDEVFGEIDKQIIRSKNNYRTDKFKSIERYGKKYSWIAFFELYGYFMLKNMIKNDCDNSYRISSVDIDPTFPCKPQKHQLVIDCFLPRYDESVQDWINEEKNNYFEKIYTFNFDDNEWVLINSYLKQENNDKVRIDIFVNTFLVDVEHVSYFIEYIKQQEYYHLDIPEFYYLFAGEIPWSKNIVYDHEPIKIDNKFIELKYPISWYSWESYHSQVNDIGNIPFISKEIAQSLELTFSLHDFSYYTTDGHLATRYFWDNYSHYLFIRKDLLKKYCNANNLDLIWYEYGTKYGEFGKYESKYKPSIKDFKFIKRLEL